MPRFLYISDSSNRVAGRRGEPRDPGAARVGWRLVAANNRALGRSTTTFASLIESVRSTETLRARVDEVSAAVLFDAAAGSWAWTVSLDAAPVATCVHDYLRRVECTRALRGFLDAVRSAAGEAEELRHLGPNALRVYASDPAHATEAAVEAHRESRDAAAIYRRAVSR